MTTPSPLLSFFVGSQYTPVHDRLYSAFLDTRDLLKLSATCSDVRNEIKHTQWNINTRLKRFFHNPVALRSQLGQSDALISGSFALQFLERVLWKESDVDIFVKSGDGAGALEKHIVEVEGYTYDSTTNILDYRTDDIFKCRTFFRGESTTRLKVQIVLTWDIPIISILRGFFTTAVVNIITWNKAYSLFPRPTFLKHETYALQKLDDYYGPLRAKYSRRGWRQRTRQRPEDASTVWSLSSRARDTNHGNAQPGRVGDGLTWTLRLDTQSVITPPTPDFVLEYSSFHIEAPRPSSEPFRPTFFNHEIYVVQQAFRSNVLQYRFSYVNFDLWCDRIGTFMEEATWAQMFKLKPEDRPAGLERMSDHSFESPDDLRLYDTEFEKPEGWDYFDDEIPVMWER